MKSVEGKTFSAYVRPKLHSGHITVSISSHLHASPQTHNSDSGSNGNQRSSVVAFERFSCKEFKPFANLSDFN